MIICTNSGQGSRPADSYAELLRFDRKTGILSSPIQIPVSGTYGADFSPLGQYLYMAVTESGVQRIAQYDVSIYNSGAINASKSPVAAAGFATTGAIQLAPDRKIYVAGSVALNGSQAYNYISAINAPEQKGTLANYSTDPTAGAILVNNLPQGSYDTASVDRLAQYGLPAALPHYKSNTSFTATAVCDTGYKYTITLKPVVDDGETYYARLNNSTTPVIFTGQTSLGPLHVGKTYSILVYDRFGDTLAVLNGKPSCDYIIGGGEYRTCDNYFLDDNNGVNGAYSPNQDYTTKICSNNGGRVRLQFDFFEIAATQFAGDRFTVSDAVSGTTFYSSNGSYPTIRPTVITSDAVSSCLLVSFSSNASQELAGWRAKITCLQPTIPACDTTICKNQVSDDCSTACTLPLTKPKSCDENPSDVTYNSFCLTNIGATPSIPYVNQSDCQPNDGITALPASDVWFKFTAVSNTIHALITNCGIKNPSLVLYQGDCNSLIGKSCTMGTDGLFGEFENLEIGKVYYLQVAGGNINDRGNFQLTIKNFNSCTQCGIITEFTSSPAPVNGRYNIGDVVRFKFKIKYWDPIASDNWVHSVIPEFGSGWDLSSLTYILPPPCNNTGKWIYVNHNVTSSANGRVFGPGFYYETTQVSAGDPPSDPNNPGDNWGDGGNSCTNGNIPAGFFEYEFSVRVKECPSGLVSSNLNIVVNVYGDYQSGSYTTNVCEIDSPKEFSANGTCCAPATVSETRPTSCPTTCNGYGRVRGNGTSPFRFVWKDGSNNVVRTQTGVTSEDSIPNLCAGFYVVDVTDATGCLSTVFFEVKAGAQSTYTVTYNDSVCENTPVQFTIKYNGTGPYNISYKYDGASTTLTNQVLSSTINLTSTSTKPIKFYNFLDQGKQCGIADTLTKLLHVNPLPVAVLYGSDTICEGDSGRVFIDVDGNPNFTASLIGNGAPLTASGLKRGTNTVYFKPVVNTIYSISGIVDGSKPGQCVGVNFSGEARITVKPAPTLVLSGRTETCLGDSASIVARFTGLAPFSLSMRDQSLQSYSLLTSRNVDTLKVLPVQGVNRYDNTIMTDANGCRNLDKTDTFRIVVAAPPSVVLSGVRKICEGDSTSVNLFLTGIAPFVVVLEDQKGRTYPFTIPSTGAQTVSFIPPVDTITLSVRSINDGTQSRCPGSGSGNARVTVVPAPYAKLVALSPKLCQDSLANIRLDISGTPPFNIVLFDGTNQFTRNGIPSDFVFSTPIDTTTTFSVRALTDGGTPTCSFLRPDSVKIEVFEPIEAILVEERCNADLSEFQAIVEVSGGDPATYKANGVPFTGVRYTSPVYPNGASYQIVFSDETNCSVSLVDDKRYCQCITEAGTMDLRPLQFCENVPAVATYQNNAIVETDDTLLYVLHDKGGISLGTVYSVSGTPSFNYIPGTLTYGKTYYISHIVGNKNAARPNGIDMDDTCFAVSRGTPVRWNQLPGGTIRGNATICAGNTTPLTLSLTGRAPFRVVLSVNGVDSVLTGLSATTVLNVTPQDSTTYRLKSITDSNTPTCSVNLTDSARVLVNQLPTAVISGGSTICEGNTTPLVIRLTGSSPWRIDYTLNNVPQPQLVVFNSPFTLNASQQGTYKLTGVTDRNCTGRVGSELVEVKVSRRPVANAGEDFTNCGITARLNAVPSFGTGTWTGPGIFSDEHDPRAFVLVSGFGQYTFTWTEANSPCPNSTDQV
ncbi:MAG: hypothetical protein V4616_13175, partial [Bacteroidota bacterium]